MAPRKKSWGPSAPVWVRRDQSPNGMPGYEKGRVVIHSGETNAVVLLGQTTDASLARTWASSAQILMSLVPFPKGVTFDPQMPVISGTNWLKWAKKTNGNADTPSAISHVPLLRQDLPR